MLKTFTAVPLPVTLVVLAFICPTELSVFIGGMRFSPHRLVFLLVLPFALTRLARSRDLKVRAFDVLFLLYNAWTVGVFIYHGDATPAAVSNQGSGGALQYGGALALESFAAYVIARAYVRDAVQARAVAKLLVAAVMIVGALALPETLLGQHFVHDAMNALTGYGFPLKYETRLGLERAYSTFDHPIHYGTFCASALALVWFAERKPQRQWTRAGLLTLATILGLSSAPILCLALQAALIVWEALTRGVVNRVQITLGVFAALYLGAALVGTRTPIGLIATGMTLDSWTGYYRLVIWEHGIENLTANPISGIGLADWTRPWWMISDSIDAFWLVIPLRAGVPAIVFLVGALALLLRTAARRSGRSRDLEVRRMLRGWVISVIALCLVGVTVHFWNVLYAYFFFMLGLGGWLADPQRVVARATLPVARRSRTQGRAAGAARPGLRARPDLVAASAIR
jgi:hypothetical protein